MLQNGVGKETYANVTHMVDFNKKLMHRIKNTDNMLKGIMDLLQANGTNSSNTSNDPRIIEISKCITEHFKYAQNHNNISQNRESAQIDK